MYSNDLLQLEEKIDALSKESRKYQREVELSNSTITSLREDVEKVQIIFTQFCYNEHSLDL